MPLTKATFSIISGTPVNVLDYIPQQYHADIQSFNVVDVVDVRQYVQAAIDACPQGHAVFFPAGLYKITPVDVGGTKIGLKVYASTDHNGITLYGESDGYFSTTVESSTIWFDDVNAYGFDVVNQSTVIKNLSICYAFDGTRPVGNGSAIRVGSSTTKVYGCIIKDCWFTEIPSSCVFIINGFAYLNTCTVELAKYAAYVDATLYNNRPSIWVWQSNLVGCDEAIYLKGSNSAPIVTAQINDNAFGSNGVNGGHGSIYASYVVDLQVVGNVVAQDQGQFAYLENCTGALISDNQGSLFNKNAVYSINGLRNAFVNNNFNGFDALNSNTYSGIVLDGTESEYIVEGNIVIGSSIDPAIYGIYGLRVDTTAKGTLGINRFAGKIASALLPTNYSRIDRQTKSFTSSKTTTNATPTIVGQVTGADIPAALIDNNFQIEVNVIGSGASGVYASYKQIYSLRVSSGNVWIISASTFLVSQESDASFDCTGSVAGGPSFDIVVTGGVGTNITWNAEIILRGIGQI